MFARTAVRRTPRPRLTRVQQRAARKKDILDAAWAVYLQCGYEGATMDAIAQAAGISRMPIFTLFRDKQNLYSELKSAMLEALLAQMVAALGKGRSLRAGLEQLAALLVALSSDKTQVGPDSLFNVVQVIALSRPDIARRQREEANHIIGTLADCIRKSPLAAGDRLRGSAEQVAALLVAQINGLANVEHQTGRRYARAADLTALFHAAAFR